MDERDFAELISVFLKGSEPAKTDEQATKNENPAEGAAQPPTEAEIRKNIIEALAERIKESSVPKAEGQEQAGSPDQAQSNGDKPEIEPRPVKSEAVEEAQASEEWPAAEELSPETVVTEEEVETLLIGSEPPEIIPLQRILHRFLELDGIMAAVLVTSDGFTVDYVSAAEIELDMFSAVISTGFAHFQKIGGELHHGGLQIGMLEYENGPVVVATLTHDVYLVVIATQWATLGRIRWEIKKQADELLANL